MAEGVKVDVTINVLVNAVMLAVEHVRVNAVIRVKEHVHPLVRELVEVFAEIIVNRFAGHSADSHVGQDVHFSVMEGVSSFVKEAAPDNVKKVAAALVGIPVLPHVLGKIS